MFHYGTASGQRGGGLCGAGGERETERSSQTQRVSRQGLNYFVLKPVGRKLSFTVFPHKGQVIGTGIKDYGSVQWALEVFAHAAGMSNASAVQWERRIVNSTYCGRIVCSQEQVSTSQVLYRFTKEAEPEDKRNVSVSFRPHFFPGALVRCSNGEAEEGEGTVNLFNNGSYVLVGVTTYTQARKVYERICAIIETYWTTSAQPTSCAWTAGSSWVP